MRCSRSIAAGARLQLARALARDQRLRVAPLRGLELACEALGVVGAEHRSERGAALGRAQLGFLELRQPPRRERSLAGQRAQLLDVAHERVIGVGDARLGDAQVAERGHEVAPAGRALGERRAHRARAPPGACEREGGERREHGAGREREARAGERDREDGRAKQSATAAATAATGTCATRALAAGVERSQRAAAACRSAT